jgi:hypothetical protein
MNDTKPVNPEPGTELPIEQAAEVGGGDGTQSCPITTTVSTSTGVTVGGGMPGDVVIAIYDGAVDVTSHIMERVLGTAK